MPENVIRVSDLDSNFKFEIAKTYEGRTVLWCVQCGMCTSNCPYSEVLDVQPHQVIKMVLLGMRETAISCETIWKCATCFMCAERCPQGVEVANVMFALKNIAAREKAIPEGYKIFGQQVYKTGRATEVTPLRSKERMNLGLPKVPQIDAEAIKKLLKKTRLTGIIEAEEGKKV